ncbi:MAG: Bax inhibitor-1 family protein, partial [archaeon]|nr:Bax inhibitor-1 family protein [archaeon]
MSNPQNLPMTQNEEGFNNMGAPLPAESNSVYPEIQNNSNQNVESQISYPVPQMSSEYDHQKVEEMEADDNEANVDSNIRTTMRIGFIRKVYGILSAQLLFTTFLISLTAFDSVKNFFLDPTVFLYVNVFGTISLIVFMILVYCTKCCKGLKRIDYLILFGFTLSMSLILMSICSLYPFSIVLFAALLTTGITIGATIYAMRTQNDFSFCGAFLFGMVACVFISMIFLLIGAFFFKIAFYALEIICCLFGVFVYGLYLIYDTQLIMGKFGREFGIDDYIIAALNVYLDIINIFLKILRILGMYHNYLANIIKD